AEHVGLDEQAHEQAKWFGDDIALKAVKYTNGRAAAAAMRLVGSGNPPLHRFRVGLEFLLSGHREVDGMLNHHSAMARTLAPQLAPLFRADAELILSGLDSVGSWSAVIDAEPALAVVLSGEAFDTALEAIANFVDLKSPYSLGHARAVADLVAAAGVRLGLSGAEVRTLRRAGLAHDLGRLGVSNSIWDKAGPLGAGEWERVRMHPYLTERMLNQSEALAPLAAIAVQHRERLDGSGYPRGLAGGTVSRPARILGAAGAYQAMRQPRPYRPALW